MPAKPATSWHSFAFLVAFVLLAALGWQGKRSQEALLEANQSVNHSLEVITATQAILSSLQDIETGVRGFVLTGEPDYLEPYERGLMQLEQHRRRLQMLSRDHIYPAPQWFDRLDERMADRLTIAADNIQTRRDTDLQTAAAYLAQAGGKEVMDQLRVLLAAVEQHERRRLTEGSRAVAETIERNRQFALIGSLLVAILFLAAMWSVQRNLRLRQALAVKAQAGEARLGALLQAIPNNLYAIDDERRCLPCPSRAKVVVHRPVQSSRCWQGYCRRRTTFASCARRLGANMNNNGHSRYGWRPPDLAITWPSPATSPNCSAAETRSRIRRPTCGGLPIPMRT